MTGEAAPFTHDLVALSDWLQESGLDLSPYERVADLTFFAFQTRYDDSLEIKSPDWPLLRRRNSVANRGGTTSTT